MGSKVDHKSIWIRMSLIYIPLTSSQWIQSFHPVNVTKRPAGGASQICSTAWNKQNAIQEECIRWMIFDEFHWISYYRVDLHWLKCTSKFENLKVWRILISNCNHRSVSHLAPTSHKWLEPQQSWLECHEAHTNNRIQPVCCWNSVCCMGITELNGQASTPKPIWPFWRCHATRNQMLNWSRDLPTDSADFPKLQT